MLIYELVGIMTLDRKRSKDARDISCFVAIKSRHLTFMALHMRKMVKHTNL